MRWRLFSRPHSEPALAQRPFEWLSVTMAVVLASHLGHLPWWLGAALILVLLMRLLSRRRRAGAAPVWLKLPLVGLLLLALLGQYGNLFSREAGAALVVGMLVLKLLETERVRDARVAAAIACFALMSALLFDQGLLMTLLVALGLLPALTSLRVLQPARRERPFRTELWPTLRLLGAALPLALLAFVLVPRLGTPLWGAPDSQSSQTGLSEQMSPGDFTELLIDESPAMRVDFEGPPPPVAQRYFRGYVMWRYDGRSWAYWPRPGAPAVLQASRQIGYHINLLPTRQRVLPTLDVPLAAPANASLRADHETFADRPVDDPRDYSLHSAVNYQLQEQLDQRTRQLGLQLPKGFNPRALALAASWRQRYGDDHAAIAQAALQLFQDGGFSYTLNPPPLGRDAVDDFLFSTRSGFCEHFASAFTVLMRAAGLPARVITGYQGGYWNAQANYLLVRQSDAHAWSEVWLAGRGWVRFDPTAAVRPERVTLGAAGVNAQDAWPAMRWLGDWRNRWDVVNRWWNQGVVGFDALRQRGMLTPFGIADLDSSMLGILLAVSLSLFALLGLAWALRGRKREPLHRFIRTLEHKLARAGLPRRPGEGPKDYFGRAISAFPADRRKLEVMMAGYLQLRYAHDEPPPESVRDLVGALRNFRPRGVVK